MGSSLENLVEMSLLLQGLLQVCLPKKWDLAQKMGFGTENIKLPLRTIVITCQKLWIWQKKWDLAHFTCW